MDKPIEACCAEVSSRSSVSVWGVALGMSHILALVPLLLILVVIVPSFEKIFMDFGTELPAMTLFVVYLSFSPLLCVSGFLLFSIVDVILLAGLWSNSATRPLAVTWAIVVWIVIVIAYPLIVGSLFMPLISLMQDLA